jgi:hypothetical protein
MSERNGRTGQPAAKPPVMLDEAMKLHKLGWSLMPLCNPHHKGKHPSRHAGDCQRPGKMPVLKWKPLQLHRLTELELWEHWNTNGLYNLGVVTGRISGVVMVDVDTEEGLAHWRDIAGDDDGHTWVFGTGRGGLHFVYAWNSNLVPTGNPFPGLKGHLDFLGEGHQSVIPPSLHSAGVRYEWIHGGPDSGVPLTEAPRALLDLLEKANAANREPAAGGQHAYGSNNYKRAVAWAKGFEGSVSESGGHDVAFTLADSLVNGYGLGEDDAIHVMKAHWNDRCRPPWSDMELWHKVKQARERGKWQPVEEKPMSKAPKAGKATKASGEPAPFKLGTSVNASEYGWFFPPFFPRGVASFLVGKPGVGKSTFQAHLASKAKRTLFLPGEEDVERTLLPRLEDAGVPRDKWAFMEPNANWTFPDHCDKYAALLKDYEFDLVVVDPIDDYLSRGFDDNNSQQVRELLNALRRLCEQTQACMVLCRHPGKSEENVMVGSRAWRAVPRVIVELVKDDGPPVRRIIRHYKNNIGQFANPRYYDLPLLPNGRPTFSILGDVEGSEAELAKEFTERAERVALEDACHFLRGFLNAGEVEANQVYQAGDKERLSARTLRRAAERVGVEIRRVGSGRDHRSMWKLKEGVPVSEDGQEGVAEASGQSDGPECLEL